MNACLDGSGGAGARSPAAVVVSAIVAGEPLGPAPAFELCVMCGKDLGPLPLFVREAHVNRCLDAAKPAREVKPRAKPAPKSSAASKTPQGSLATRVPLAAIVPSVAAGAGRCGRA
jgi:hypothetical protein